MAAPVNKFKQRLRSGEVQIGCWNAMANAYASEMLGMAGFDWVLIDGEHAPNDIPVILAQLQVLDASKSEPVVRLPIGNEVMVKQILDLGAQSLLIPLIESAEQAKEMVAATRYPPQGRRGVGAAPARASGFSTIPNYTQTANDQICLLLQVENLRGLAALDEILQVEGVDGVFIGPADLSADMGYPGQTAHPEVRAKVIDALTKIKQSDKAAGILSTDEAFSRQCIEMGVEFTAVGLDVVEYVNALRTLATKFLG